MTDTKTKPGRRNAALLAALLLGSAPTLLHAQGAGAGGGNGAAGAGTGAAGAGGTGAAGAGGNGVGGAGNGNVGGAAGAGNAGVGGNAAGNGTANGTTGNAAGGAAPGAPGTNGANGNNGNGGTGTSGTNGTTGTGTNVGLSNGAAPGGSVPVHGSPAPQDYDLARTVADALRASADVATATRNVQIDQKQADAEAARGRPNVNAQGTAIRYDQATKIALGGGSSTSSSGTAGGNANAAPAAQPITVQLSHKEILSLNLAEQLDITGQIRAAADQYRLQSLADRFILQQVSNARILRAKSVFFNLLRQAHQVQVAQANLTDAQQNLKDAQNQNAAGTGQKIDLLRAQTQVAQDQQQLTQALNNYNVAVKTFDDLVGRPLNTGIHAQDVPGVTAGTDVANTGAVGAPTPFPLFQLTPEELGRLQSQQFLDRGLQTAFAQRPEILADQVSVRVAQTGITLARAGLQPTLSVDANGFYYPTTDFQNPRQRTAQVSATLTIPLYDSGATRDLVQEARLRQQNAQTTLESQKSDVDLDVNQSYLNLVTAANQIDAANTALASAVAARQLAEIRYRGGVGLFLEVTDAQAALVQAENSQVNAVYDYLVAQAQFQNAIGAPQTQ